MASSSPRKPLVKRLLGPPYRWVRAKVLYLLALSARLDPRGVARLGRWLAAEALAQARRRRDSRVTVAVDVNPFWEPLTGIGWYLYRLLEHLAEREDLVLRLYGPGLVDSPDLPPPVVPLPRGRAIEVVSYHPPAGIWLGQGAWVRWLRRLTPLLIAADGNRVLFAPNFFLPHRFLFCRGRGALVATVHDLAFRHFAWTLDDRTLADLEERLDRTTFEAVGLVTPSVAVRDELVAAGLAAAQRVFAIHHGPGQLAAERPAALPPGLPARFALFVGTLEPRKNVLTLLEAWEHLAANRPDVPVLVLAGKLGWKSAPLEREIELGKSQGWLRHLGYVGNPELAALYRHATLFCFPSRYEGFGLPLLEAAAAGTPIVASDIAVLREVAGDGAVYADAESPAAWAEAIARLLADEPARQALGARARQRAAAFSWQLSAAAHAEVLVRAAGR